MLKQNCLIELGDNYLIKHDFYPRFLNRSLRNNEYNINLLKEFQFCLNNKKVYIVIEGEKIIIRKMTLPKLKKKELYMLIIEELSSSNNSADKIFFNYSIIKDNGNNLDLAVFYSNEGKIKKVERYILKNSSIEAVYLIQFCFLRYFNKAILHKDFIFVFLHKAKLYFLLCVNKKLLYNNVIQWDNKNIISESIFEFIESCRINNGMVARNIYIANVEKDVFNGVDIEGHIINNLGFVSEEILIKYIRTNRR